MTTILTKTWIHPDDDSDVRAAPLHPTEPRRFFGGFVTWTSPEGTRIIIDSKATHRVRRRRRWRRVPKYTPQGVYEVLKANGLDATIGAHLTVRVQDQYSSQATASVGSTGGRYDSFTGSIYLQGVNSPFAFSPHPTVGHEYGHIWAFYHLYMTNQNDWSSYLEARKLTGDVRLDTTYAWDRDEIIADDYRLCFGSDKAISGRPSHLNADIPIPTPDLCGFLRYEWTSAP